jgi:hypothetical protein
MGCILNSEALPNIIIAPNLHAQSIPNSILRIDHALWQCVTNTKENEERPFPSERINCNAERKPPDQLQVSEEIEGSSGSKSFNEAGHVDPALHPKSLRPSERVRQEHE